MKILEKMTMLALGTCGFVSITACSDNAAAPPIESPDSMGELGLSLQLPNGQLPNGTSIQSASYTITGPMGFIRTGTIDASASTMLTALIGGIPAGRDTRSRSWP